ncbi:hypothetical protein [Virgibacillus ndiopensis]|uniref:hypothetical protein n=1 Tax=Virgibacillus ndiopensis TaxID=2004408 RepID=UPI000C089E09|nr:hypothetical protein [Virgibacillus ndiopensis]
MKNKRKFNNFVFLSLVFIFVFGYLLAPLGKTSAAEDTGKHSGGFIIETEKVDGAMDLLGALQGKITISEGNIYGLTITKIIDRGEKESFVIKITSPGPIPIENLHAETVGGNLPTIGGICKPGKLGWVCLKDVSMKVTEQTVASINLPNATVETCYQSECGPIPNFKSTMSKEELQEKIKELEEQQSSLNEKRDGLEKDKQKLNKTKQLVTEAQEKHEEIRNGNQIEKLQKSVKTISDLLSNENHEELDFEKIISSIEALEPDYTSLSEATSVFKKTLGEAETSLEELKDSIKQTEKQLTALTTGESALSDDEMKQVETYKLLLDKVEEQQSESGINKKTKEANHSKRVDVATLKEEVEKIKSEIESVTKNIEALVDAKDEIEGQLKTMQSTINKLKARFKELLEANKDKAEGIVEEVVGSKNLDESKQSNDEQSSSENGTTEPDSNESNNSGKTEPESENDATTDNKDDEETPESTDDKDKATDEEGNAKEEESSLIDQIIDSVFGRLW